MIYLDNAATTLNKPKRVKKAVQNALDTLGNSGRGSHDPAMRAARNLYQARKKASQYFGGFGPNQTAFTSNATEALNIALEGLLNPGDHVIATEADHNSVLRPLYRLEGQGVGLTLLKADRKGNFSLEELEGAITRKTRAVVCTHASNVTGNLFLPEKIGKICRDRGIVFILDGAQTAGHAAIDMKAMGIDILCFTGHKGLMGPQGTGGLCVNPQISIRPFLVGGSGFRSFDREQPGEMPEVLEAGTLNGPGIAGLAAAFDFLAETGTEAVREREDSLAEIFVEELQKIPGVRLYGDFSGRERTAVVSLNIRDYDSKEVADVLASEYGIAVRGGIHCAPLMHRALGTEKQGTTRFSFSWFNTVEETEEAVWAVKKIAEW